MRPVQIGNCLRKFKVQIYANVQFETAIMAGINFTYFKMDQSHIMCKPLHADFMTSYLAKQVFKLHMHHSSIFQYFIIINLFP